MKNLKLLFLLLTILLLSQLTFAQTNTTATQKYDEALAKKLGADEFGMKKYVMAFLKTGKATLTKEEREKVFAGHMKNINRLADEGKLVVAGPFLDGQELQGIYIFNVETIEEAKKLTESDPAIKSGALIFELHPWYGSAAMQEIIKIHKTIEKKGIAN